MTQPTLTMMFKARRLISGCTEACSLYSEEGIVSERVIWMQQLCYLFNFKCFRSIAARLFEQLFFLI